MIRRDDENSMTTAFSDVWTTARTYRSQVLLSRMRWRESDEDRAVYNRWRRGVILFYGLLALLVFASGAVKQVIDEKLTVASAQSSVTSTAQHTP
jgi:hypothetical protein